MSTSIYDFTTQSAPFEAFSAFGPVAPFAWMAWFAMPAQWWMDTWLTACSTMSNAAIRGMVYPYAETGGGSEGRRLP